MISLSNLRHSTPSLLHSILPEVNSSREVIKYSYTPHQSRLWSRWAIWDTPHLHCYPPTPCRTQRNWRWTQTWHTRSHNPCSTSPAIKNKMYVSNAMLYRQLSHKIIFLAWCQSQGHWPWCHLKGHSKWGKHAIYEVGISYISKFTANNKVDYRQTGQKPYPPLSFNRAA